VGRAPIEWPQAGGALPSGQTKRKRLNAVEAPGARGVVRLRLAVSRTEFHAVQLAIQRQLAMPLTVQELAEYDGISAWGTLMFFAMDVR